MHMCAYVKILPFFKEINIIYKLKQINICKKCATYQFYAFYKDISVTATFIANICIIYIGIHFFLRKQYLEKTLLFTHILHIF